MDVISMAVNLYMDEYLLRLVKGHPTKKIPVSASKYYNKYADYLQNSLLSLNFDDKEKKEFANALFDYRKGFDTFFNFNDVKTLVRAKSEIIDAQNVLDYYERRLKERFISNWEDHLTDNVGEYSKFAIIVQATGEIDFRNPGRGHAIACSLFTDKLQKLYHDRKFGYVYNLKERDLVVACTRDAGANFSTPLEFYAEMDYYTVIGSLLGYAHLENQSFRFFDDFISQCDVNHLNEIIFARSSYYGQLPSGVFLHEGASEKECELVYLTARLRCLPIYEFKGNCLHVYEI